MRRPFWIRFSIGLLAGWLALAGGAAARVPACVMAAGADGADGADMAGMPGMPTAAAQTPVRMGAAAPVGRAAAGMPRGQVSGRGQAAGTSRGGHHEHAHAGTCACPSACSSAGSLLPASAAIALGGGAPGGTAPALPLHALLPARGVASHFLPFPSGPPPSV